MTRIFAASAYVAAMSLALSASAGARPDGRAVSVLAKDDRGTKTQDRAPSGGGEAVRLAALMRTGPAETTATRSDDR